MPRFGATLWIDLGGAALALALGAGVFQYVSRPFRDRDKLDNLQASKSGMERDLADVLARVDECRTQVTARQQTLREAGRLPDHAPIVECQSLLAALASDNNIRITSFLPLQDRDYPGLLEKRFTFEASGRMGDVLRFLRSIETDGKWADIGYLTLSRGVPAGPSDPGVRQLSFAVSVFASKPAPVAPGASTRDLPRPTSAAPPSG